MKKLFKVISAAILTLSLIVPLGHIKVAVAAGDKVYNVPVELWHAENSGRLSMGNNALATTATVTEHENGTSNITVQFVPMDFSNMHGHLLSLSIYSSPLFSGSLSAAAVTSTYNDTNLDGGTSTYPSTLNFNYASAKPDKIGVRVSVDAMNQIMGGDASQNAILKFNWSAASLISGSEEKKDEQKAEEKKDENKADDSKKDENKSDDSNKAPEGFVAKKLEDYFKDDQKTKNTGVYNLDITGSYLNPLTGITADGGTKNAAIGEGMVQGVISPVNAGGNLEDAMNNQQTTGEKRWSKAQLQRTKDGKLYATIRIHLMNWVERSNEQGPFIKVLQSDGEFKQVVATETKVNIEQYKDSYVDYRFEVPNENFLAMVQMYVTPMNRPVRFFVETNTDTIQSGSTSDMSVIEEKNYTPYYIGGGIAAVVIIAGGVYFVLRRNKKTPTSESKE